MTSDDRKILARSCQLVIYVFLLDHALSKTMLIFSCLVCLFSGRGSGRSVHMAVHPPVARVHLNFLTDRSKVRGLRAATHRPFSLIQPSEPEGG